MVKKKETISSGPNAIMFVIQKLAFTYPTPVFHLKNPRPNNPTGLLVVPLMQWAYYHLHTWAHAMASVWWPFSLFLLVITFQTPIQTPSFSWNPPHWLKPQGTLLSSKCLQTLFFIPPSQTDLESLSIFLLFEIPDFSLLADDKSPSEAEMVFQRPCIPRDLADSE